MFERLLEFLSPGPDSRAELIAALADAEKRELIAPESRMMLEGVIRMADLTAGDVMVAAPRMDLLAIDAPYDELLAVVIETAHSRFPVFEGRRENVIGILMAKDLLKLQRAPELNLRTLLRPAVFVPESKNLNELLRDFRSNRNHLAIVIDEFGNTAGLITIEDVLEEIVGEIEDEFDDEDAESGIYTLADGSQRVAGDTEISAVNDAFGTDLPLDGFDTIGGLIAQQLGRVPRRGETVRIESLDFNVMLTRGGAVRWFRVTRVAVPGSARGLNFAGGPDGRPQLPATLELAAAVALGALQTWAFVDTRLWWLALACVAALAWRVAGASPRRAALLGAAFGTAWLVAGVWWLFISLHYYGGLPAWMAAAAVALLALALSSYLALAMHLAARWRCRRPAADASLFAAAWLGAELARGVLFTGFPWLAFGYSQVDGPMAPLAPWVGVYGIGVLAAWLAAWLAATLAQGSRIGRLRGLALAALALALPAWFGPAMFTRPSGTLHVALLQTNVSQDEKFAAEHMPQALAWVAQAMQGADAELVIAPETAVPLLPDQLAELLPGYWQALTSHFGQPGGPAALVGVPLGSFEAGYTNSVAGLSAATAALPAGFYRYDKQHLVPFGEFIPTGFHWFTEMMNIPLGDFNRGVRRPPSFTVRGERIAPNICYEDLFGEELALRFADEASAPTLLANVSNIGWFGDTIAVRQHLQISRMRSLELQRPMLRATNTGATAVIDHQGRVTAALPTFSRGVLLASVQGRDGLTPFARWASATGLWPLWTLSAAGLLWAARRHRQPRRR